MADTGTTRRKLRWTQLAPWNQRPESGDLGVATLFEADGTFVCPYGYRLRERAAEMAVENDWLHEECLYSGRSEPD